MFKNIPTLKLGIVAVSRSCFSKELSQNRCTAVVEAYKALGLDIYRSEVLVENENDAMKALEDVNANGVNALVVYLGNFGPETPETMLAQRFNGPVMFTAAAEETKEDLFDGRGDAYCGMLNASYNLGLRGMNVYIPDYPVGTAEENAEKIARFAKIAKVVIGVRSLKVITFGPRPSDFLACNGPVQPLYDLGVEIEENSELDLLEAYKAHDNDPRINDVIEDMKADFGNGGLTYPDVLPRLAQYEITLLDWAESHKGGCDNVVFANKCWPAFEKFFGFVPCYVNGRMAAKGYPISCETDIYGALSEYILLLAGEAVPTLLDINNSVPKDLYDAYKEKAGTYKHDDMFMGFHCGNTATCLLKDARLSYQRIMKRDLEPDGEPDITRGTADGDLIAADLTLFRLQGTADCQLRCYIAEGNSLDIPSHSFGSIGVIAIPEMARFYRHVLIQKRYPHHAGVILNHCGSILFDVVKMLGIADIAYNQPACLPYPTENPFKA